MNRKWALIALVVSLALTAPAGAGAPAVPSVAPTTWARWTIDSTPNTGEYSAFVLISGDKPRFAYSAGGADPSQLHYAFPITPTMGTCGPSLSYRCDTIDTSGSPDLAGIDLRVGTDGIPRLSYSLSSRLKYARSVGSGGNCGPGNSTWLCESVDGGASYAAGYYNSMRLDAATGNPRISYYVQDYNYGDLKYAAFGVSPGNCGTGNSWKCETIENVGDVGWDTALTLTAAGQARIAYYFCGTTIGPPCDAGDLRVAQQVGSGGNCGDANSWRCDGIDTTGDVGWQSSIAIDSTDRLYIAYFACGTMSNCSDVGALRFAYQVPSGGNCGPANTWQCDTIDTGSGSDVVGQHAALVLVGPSNTPYITYLDATNNQLRLAYRVASGGNCGPGGNTWRCAVVGSADPGETGLAVDGSGTPQVVYWGGGTQTFQYAIQRWIVAAPLLTYNTP
jgi:hypothetical protein